MLISACVFGKKSDWLKNACLAAALLFPAVAALHGIALAALHRDNAVDMDVYGAFQLCAIGILAGPVTVRLSTTYFNDPGRNIIFLWTGLIFAGLLSLTVEFFRIKTLDCTSLDPTSGFDYGQSMCGYDWCLAEPEEGIDWAKLPHSPMRGGSANNIYVIPAPTILKFSTTTLIAAACCIPAVLSLVSMWNKVLEINWKTRAGQNERNNEPIEGTNGATLAQVKRIDALIRTFFSVSVEIPVFGAAVMAILIFGEMNFFSAQVRYQTEPIQSIGK